MPFFVFQYLKSFGDNFGQVTSHIYRGAEPDSKRLIKLRDQYGIQAVLNLRAEAGAEEAAEVRQAGMIWYHVPMKDDEAPTATQIDTALAVMRSGITLLVVCTGGRHRTGVICAVYRVVEQNYSKERAWKEAEKFGWYDRQHKPIRLWFENEFHPEDYARRY